MSFELEELLLVSVAYLLALFLCAWATEKGLIPKRITQHPAVYVLSLGVYASSWAYFGSLGIASEHGYVFLAFYFGVSGAFLLAPVLLHPILRITRTYQLSSLADLFAFRFRSPVAGTFATVLMLTATMPLLSLQIQAVSDSIHLISKEYSPEKLAIVFCIMVALFAALFGTRHLSTRDRHQGLVMAIAVESLVKLLVMMTLGLVILFEVFNGLDGVEAWLAVNQDTLSKMQTPLEDGPWRSMLLMFFASAIVMPHMFHMTFAENRSRRSLHIASWALPLFLLVLSLPTLLILWAGIKLDSPVAADYFPLFIGQALGMPWLTIVAYIGGLAAASGLTIVTTLALSSMIMNHIVLPYYPPHIQVEVNIYRWLTWFKRSIILALILGSYGFYRMLEAQHALYNLGVIAYVGALQLLPGALCVLYWPKANHKGFISGLIAGTTIWFFTMMLPQMVDFSLYSATLDEVSNYLYQQWHLLGMTSLTVNAVLIYLVSSLTSMSSEERSAASACQVESSNHNEQKVPEAKSAHDFHEMLSKPLGALVAHKEVARALSDLNMREDEKRPHALRRLRERIEKNLSGLMGPTVSHDIVDTFLPWDENKGYVAQDIHFMESRLEAYHSRLSGLAGELDDLRRYHRDTLNNLPMALCSVDVAGEIMLWNQAMSQMTDIPATDVLGSPLNQIAAPWNDILSNFTQIDSEHLPKHGIEVNGQLRYFNLHKASIEAPVSGTSGNKVMLLEDHTENQMLEDQLFHSERLASIGQLAAGVAHEIGNPVTAIDCLAQELKALSEENDTREVAGQVLEQTKRVSKIVQMLMSYSHNGKNRSEMSSHAPVDLFTGVQESISLLQLGRKSSNISFLNLCDPEHKVTGDQQKLQQVFINLLNNAVDASDEKSTITIRTSASVHTVKIEVEDQGHGIPVSIQERLFEPFFTTKEAGKGTGLGLALTWNIIEEHFGTIKVISPTDKNLEKGTRFEISLPRHEPQSIRQQHGYMTYQPHDSWEQEGETV
ncbi:ATP-binding protein [Endozoicomonas numazuensis]|uniref:ATP-binding protein n=1 Tax=Endozoicomonas numazuensis TaxID=1137799 RepID=UPI0009DF81BF|nr:ATP-binding protein [Endozoicomonas numazuensis]